MPPKQSAAVPSISQGPPRRNRSTWRSVLDSVAAPENRSVVRAGVIFIVSLQFLSKPHARGWKLTSVRQAGVAALQLGFGEILIPETM